MFLSFNKIVIFSYVFCSNQCVELDLISAVNICHVWSLYRQLHLVDCPTTLHWYFVAMHFGMHLLNFNKSVYIWKSKNTVTEWTFFEGMRPSWDISFSRFCNLDSTTYTSDRLCLFSCAFAKYCIRLQT